MAGPLDTWSYVEVFGMIGFLCGDLLPVGGGVQITCNVTKRDVDMVKKLSVIARQMLVTSSDMPKHAHCH
jgi:hypothetical protein